MVIYLLITFIILGYFTAKKKLSMLFSVVLSFGAGLVYTFLIWFNSFGSSATSLNIITKWIALYAMAVFPTFFFRAIEKDRSSPLVIRILKQSHYLILIAVSCYVICTNMYQKQEYAQLDIEIVSVKTEKLRTKLIYQKGKPYTGFLDIDMVQGYLFVECSREYRGYAYIVDGKIYSSSRTHSPIFDKTIGWQEEERVRGEKLPQYKDYQPTIENLIDRSKVVYYSFEPHTEEDSIYSRVFFGYVTMIMDIGNGKYEVCKVSIGSNGLVRTVAQKKHGATNTKWTTFPHDHFGIPDKVKSDDGAISRDNLVFSEFNIMEYLEPVSKVNNILDNKLQEQILREFNSFVD